ncbi:MAG: hypothetical protein AAGH40_07290 [Verrucomicrobiota bacterium]
MKAELSKSHPLKDEIMITVPLLGSPALQTDDNEEIKKTKNNPNRITTNFDYLNTPRNTSPVSPHSRVTVKPFIGISVKNLLPLKQSPHDVGN